MVGQRASLSIRPGAATPWFVTAKHAGAFSYPWNIKATQGHQQLLISQARLFANFPIFFSHSFSNLHSLPSALCPSALLPPPPPPLSRIVAIIPARFGSTRFPGKPLHLIAGQSLIERTWRRCLACRMLSRVLIATDDERIMQAAADFGAEAVLTSPDHPSGTDRLAEAAVCDPEATHFINVQGDEPLISPVLIDELATRLASDPAIRIITAVHPLPDAALQDDPNIVKAVLDSQGRALYFSRSPLPYMRNPQAQHHGYRHMGIYGYSRAFLNQFVSWPPSLLELTEGLEQLRALENGASIHCVITQHDSPGIDTLIQAETMESELLAAETAIQSH